MLRKLTLLALFTLLLSCRLGAQEGGFADQRRLMTATIRAYANLDLGELGEEGISEKVLGVMGRTERHLFVPERFASLAYADRALPIDHNQTISQPFVVALMTHLVRVEAGDTALEIGTGSGYQAAILSQLAKRVCTIEIIRPLGLAAAKRLRDLGYDNVRVKVGDGYKGWANCGPFDVIVVTAALGHVPQPLVDQLKVGGKLIMPVGEVGATQQLTLIEKTAPGKTVTRSVGSVRFVPFVRKTE